MTLDKLTENQSGIIKKIHDPHLALRLISMGFVIGNTIKLERIAPLKDPLLIASDSTYISIRKSDAENIEIDKIE